jgi:L-malate glycosyltransferase
MKSSAAPDASNRLNVLFVTTWYPSANAPVAGVFVREYAKAVARYDNVAVLHCPELSPDLDVPWRVEVEQDAELTADIPTYRLHYRRSPVPKTTYLVQLTGVMAAYRRIVAAGFRPDVLHAHIYKAGVLAVILGKLHHKPVVVSEHYSIFARRALTGIDLWQAKFAFTNARRVLPVSVFLQRAIEDNGIRARFQVVPNVVDTDLFRPEAHPLLRPGPKKLLYVGSLEPTKGTDDLLRALARLRDRRDDWQLDMIGGGSREAEYQSSAAELGLEDKITFRGIRSKAEVARFMQQADLFVLPSIIETFSVATAEALATGTPVLVTDCGGPTEFVTPEVGSVVPPRDPEALCAKLDTMLDGLAEYPRAALSRYAQELFGPGAVGLKLHAVYQSVASR